MTYCLVDKTEPSISLNMLAGALSRKEITRGFLREFRQHAPTETCVKIYRLPDENEGLQKFHAGCSSRKAEGHFFSANNFSSRYSISAIHKMGISPRTY